MSEGQTIAAGARTAGPWDYFVGNANGRGLIRIEAGIDSPEAGKHIASMPRGPASEANAATLCQAVNDHADLIAALKLALPYVERVATTAPPEYGRQVRQRQACRDADTIRAAIAKTGRTAT